MNPLIKTILRWLLVVIALSASSFAVFVLLMGLMMWPDRSIVADLSAIGVAPHAVIEAVHRLDFFITMLIWVVPPACAVGFAAHTQQRKALRWATSIAILLFATFCFFLGRSDSQIGIQWIAVIAALIVLTAAGFSFSKLNSPQMMANANLLAILLLFLPSASALLRKTGALPQPKALWSTILQPQEWFQQSMNTGSEYAATRQVVFAADRVVAVLDTGLEPNPPSQGKWPNSNYRLVSLDAKTGARKNEMNFVGRWGAMPYIYATKSGQIDIQSNPPRRLNPDLTATNSSGNAAPASPTVSAKEAASSNYDFNRHTLPNNQILKMDQKQFQLLDSNGKILNKGNLLDWGTYAGSSADGRRFATESSYTEGDPDFVVYEYFTIYNLQSGKAIATIHVKDLPERQSWSAFSPDGRYFVMGNPNKLTMYLLP